jgi:RHS repeat-associated protein
LKLQQETGPLPNSAIAYAYDELGRLNSRTVAGAGAETFAYDTLGRLSGHTSDLGSFALSYLGQTGQIAQRQLLPATGTLETNWSYLPNSGDRRLAEIANVGLSANQFSTYQFTTTRENFISAITETSDTALVYPGTGTQTASYNNLNQLTNFSGQALSYDSNGNLLSDGQRTYSWDAENRLVSISYPGQAGKQTDFVYDGLGRRTAISSTPPGGGSAVTTAYLWCGIRICQARDASNSPTRGYYDEGEFVPGTPGQTYYYGADQIGSVRRVFASTTNAPAYSYDPYGVPLQGTALLTDFGYATMFYNADSGLYLTQYRVYDPVAGRWLSRDPIGEMSNRPGSTISVFPADAVGTSTTLTSDRGEMEAAHSFAFKLINSGGGLRNDGSFEIFGPQGVNAHRSLWPSHGPGPLGVQYNLYQYVYGNPVSHFDPRGDLWANVAGAAAGFAGGVLSNLFEQGLGQALGGSPCPPSIDPVQAIYAGIAGGLAGAINPVAGASAFGTVILQGATAGVIFGVLISHGR